MSGTELLNIDNWSVFDSIIATIDFEITHRMRDISQSPAECSSAG